MQMRVKVILNDSYIREIATDCIRGIKVVRAVKG